MLRMKVSIRLLPLEENPPKKGMCTLTQNFIKLSTFPSTRNSKQIYLTYFLDLFFYFHVLL